MNDHPRSWWSTALGWVALASATLALHLVGRGALRPPPLSSAHSIATWWHQRGPLLATFAAARQLLGWTGCYLLLLWTLAALATWGRSDGVIRNLLRWRLPGIRTVLRASIGVSALGATLLSNAAPGVAADRGSPGGAAKPAAPPVLRYAGPAAGDIQGGSTPAAAPALRHVGPAAGDIQGTGSTPVATPPVRHAGPGRAPPTASTSAPAGPEAGGLADQTPGTGSQPSPANKSAAGQTPGTGSQPSPANKSPAGQTPGTGSQPPTASAADQTPRTVSQPPPATTGKGRAPIPVATSSGGVPASSLRPVKLSPLTPDHLAPLSRPVGRAATSDGGTGPARMWRVSPGDSLWSIAEATLATVWGRTPDERELAHYWWQVVQTNRPFLPIPADPNLLFPGDQVLIPPPPAAPDRES